METLDGLLSITVFEKKTRIISCSIHFEAAIIETMGFEATQYPWEIRGGSYRPIYGDKRAKRWAWWRRYRPAVLLIGNPPDKLLRMGCKASPAGRQVDPYGAPSPGC